MSDFVDLKEIESIPSVMGAAHIAAGSDTNATKDWFPMQGSANADMEGELGIMMSRARDLDRNNGVAAGVNQTRKDNIIGSILRLSAKPSYHMLNKDIEWQREWSKNTQEQFKSWADSTECDAGRSLNLLALSLQMLSGSFLNGDALAIPIWKDRGGSNWGTRLKIIEADRLATPPGMETRKGLFGGVQHDADGEPLGYWIMKRHPGDKWSQYGYAVDEWEYITAFDDKGRRKVIHLHDKERAGASRAKPLIAAVMREFKMAGQYTATELETSIGNAMIAGALESDLDPDSMAAIFGEGAKKKYEDYATGFNGKVQGAKILKTPPGTKLNLFDTGRNHADFDQYMMTVFRLIAAGLNMPYELLMKDFSKTNYSSARASLLEAWRYFSGRRRWLMDNWLNPVYELWLEEAIARGRVPVANPSKNINADLNHFIANKYAYTSGTWIMSGRGWVDPVKEAKAAQLRIEMGLSTLEQESAELIGGDWQAIAEQRAHEKEIYKELGLSEPKVEGDVSQHFNDDQDAQDDKDNAQNSDNKPNKQDDKSSANGAQK